MSQLEHLVGLIPSSYGKIYVPISHLCQFLECPDYRDGSKDNLKKHSCCVWRAKIDLVCLVGLQDRSSLKSGIFNLLVFLGPILQCV